MRRQPIEDEMCWSLLEHASLTTRLTDNAQERHPISDRTRVHVPKYGTKRSGSFNSLSDGLIELCFDSWEVFGARRWRVGPGSCESS